MSSRSLFGLLATAFVVGACGQDDPAEPAGPSMAVVAGSYAASDEYGAYVLTTTSNDSTIDWLARGGSVVIELTADGRTTGRVFIPGADEDGSDFEEDLTGTWALRGDTVTFSHDADTFIRDMDFLAADGRLSGQETFDGVRIDMVLEKR